MADEQVVCDWRGTPIRPGDTVIYCVPRGGISYVVEGVVLRTTPNAAGRIPIRPIRRSVSNALHTRVNNQANVSPMNLTVVKLPPSNRATEQDMNTIGASIARGRTLARRGHGNT